MPDEKPKGAVAGEEEPAPLAGPPEAPESLGKPEDTPTLAQEPPPPGGESVAEEEEAEGEPGAEEVATQFLDRIAEIAKEDPELAEKLYDRLPQELRDRHAGPEAEREKLDRDKAQTERQGEVGVAWQAVSPYTSQNLEPAIKTWAEEQTESVRKAAQDVIDGKEQSLGDPLDADTMTARILSTVNAASGAWLNLAEKNYWAITMAALEDGGVHKYLTADERKLVKEARQKGVDEGMPAVLKLYFGAATRTAPEQIQREADAKAEKEKGSAQALKEVLEKLPTGNGRKATRGAAPPGRPRSDADLKADPDTPIDKVMEIRARERAG